MPTICWQPLSSLPSSFNSPSKQAPHLPLKPFQPDEKTAKSQVVSWSTPRQCAHTKPSIMSNYNEYLHSDFKRLGFPEYIKMLDGELRLKDVTFLFTRQNLLDPPFFGKYNTEFRFAIVHPPEESGKRPY